VTAPTFTVVMPAHNAAATIASAIGSVLAQSRRDFELIIVDDGSSDETMELAEDFTRDSRVHVLAQEHSGPSAARNKALEVGRGRYLSMIDSDDLWLPSYLAAAADSLERERRAGFAYTNVWILDDSVRRVRRKTSLDGEARAKPWLEPAALLRALAQRNFLSNMCTVRRSALDVVGGWNENLEAANDYELWLRVAAAGFGAVRMPGCHAIYRIRARSIQQGPEGSLTRHRALREAYRLVAEEYGGVPDDVRELSRSNMRWLDRRIAKLERAGLPAKLWRTLRTGLGRVKRLLLRRLLWLSAPPPEVARALRAGRRQTRARQMGHPT
jgi:glycosyltransferase involved in cell wall biosynthesis